MLRTPYDVWFVRVIMLKLDDGLAAVVADYAVHLGVGEEEFVRMCLFAQLGIEYKETCAGDFDGVGEGD